MSKKRIDFIIHVKSKLTGEQIETMEAKLKEIENVIFVFGSEYDIEIKSS